MSRSTDDQAQTEAREIANLALTLADEAEMASNGHAVLIPDGYRLQDTERFQEAPRRVEEIVRAHTLDGFLAYFRDYANETTAVFGHPLDGQVTAVFDYHQPTDQGAGRPEWAGHQAQFEPKRSRQLSSWMQEDGALFTQQDFAHFIEEHADDVVEPTPARMLEIVREFEATRNLDFRQATRTQSGDIQITYEEETQAAGEMTVPHTIQLSLPVHKGGLEFVLEARFMYRVEREGLRLKYKLLRVDDLLEQAARQGLEHVKEVAGEKGVPVYYVTG